MRENRSLENAGLREGVIPVNHGGLYYREIGRGQPVIVLHGGPDFDHNYLLPDLDRLAEDFRLIYYDQRGRGKSGGDVRPEDVSLQSELEDLESLREYFRLNTTALLGHSWGGLLALEYALHHPERVSHLVLLNTAPASHADFLLLRQAFGAKDPGDLEKMSALKASSAYAQGDVATDLAYYRIHFRSALRRPEHFETLIRSLRSGATQEGIRKARAIEEHLLSQTWLVSEYNLLPGLRQLHIPTLVIHGKYDIIPVECAAHIAQAVSGARFVLLNDAGHFSYMETPEEVRSQIVDFMQGAPQPRKPAE